jgi:hypothetical protein
MANSVEAPTIGMWGPPRAGKTTYLAALYQWSSTFRESRWSMLTRGEEAHRFVELAANQLLDNRGPRTGSQGSFPKSTDQDRVFAYEFRIVKKAIVGGFAPRSFDLTFNDAAGAAVQHGNDKIGYFDSLRACNGILCLIDPIVDHRGDQPGPLHTEESYLSLLGRLFTELSRGGEVRRDGYLPINVAFCISKIDLDEHWPWRDRPEEHCREIIGDRAFELILKRCHPARRSFSAVSAVGRYRPGSGEERPNVESAGDYFRVASPAQWKPFQLAKPLAWLLSRIEDQRDEALSIDRRLYWAMLRRMDDLTD